MGTVSLFYAMRLGNSQGRHALSRETFGLICRRGYLLSTHLKEIYLLITNAVCLCTSLSSHSFKGNVTGDDF